MLKLESTPKTITLRFRAINVDTFEAIRRGVKKVETRAASKKYRHINPGDMIIFSCGKKKFKKSVKRIKIFKNISRMLKTYRVKDIMPKLKTSKELTASYYSYPKYREKIRKYGIIVLELK